MTQEEKAKAYDIALDKIKRLLGTGSNCSREDLEYVFPELAESEDERIRKHLIEVVELYYGYTDEQEKKDCLDWLEKQGEHAKFWDSIQVGDKVTRNQDGVLVNLSRLKRVAKRDEKQGEQKPVQEIEPAPIFKIGDILKRKGKDYTFRVDRIQGGYYHCDRNHGAFFPIEEQGNWELVEQKSIEWSEEDKEIIDYLIDYLESGLDSSYTDLDKETFTKEINWLKSLRPQSQWKPSDEEIEALEKVLKYFHMSKARGETIDGLKELLEQLLEQLKRVREE